MCTSSGYVLGGDSWVDCGYQVRVEGTAAAGHYDRDDDGTYHQATLNSGDAVFCSP